MFWDLIDNTVEVWYNSICGKPNASVRAYYALASGMTAGVLCGSCGRLLSSGVFVILDPESAEGGDVLRLFGKSSGRRAMHDHFSCY